MVSFHPSGNHILVLSSFGDLINWNYEMETTEEVQFLPSFHLVQNNKPCPLKKKNKNKKKKKTHTIMNIEHILAMEPPPSPLDPS